MIRESLMERGEIETTNTIASSQYKLGPKSDFILFSKFAPYIIRKLT